MGETIVVYDQRFQFYEEVMEKLTDGIEDIELVEWNNPTIQAILANKFGYSAFVFILIEDDNMYVGDEAVWKFCNLFDLTESTRLLMTKGYTCLSEPIGLVLHGRKPDDISGIYKLNEQDLDIIKELARD